MSSLWDEVQNLKATMKQWEIVTLNKTSTAFTYGPIPEKYLDWNWEVLTGSTNSPFVDENLTSFSKSNNSFNVKTNGNSQNVSWSKSGNNIKINIGRGDWISSSITVLFYK